LKILIWASRSAWLVRGGVSISSWRVLTCSCTYSRLFEIKFENHTKGILGDVFQVEMSNLNIW